MDPEVLDHRANHDVSVPSSIEIDFRYTHVVLNAILGQNMVFSPNFLSHEQSSPIQLIVPPSPAARIQTPS